ncbi:MAG TPA: MotA/TolQ/ExbB proton channel family protein [Chlamydiales bacterium]|nr:MotA/TolQ/ExbB proton channel family protein [Chlamydiales bacterium]
MFFLLASNPFLQAYTESDLLGKLIFIGLIALSIITWSVFVHKLWITRKVKKESLTFRKAFFEQKQNPLEIHYETNGAKGTSRPNPECPNAFSIIYEVIKTKTNELLDKNQKLAPQALKKNNTQLGYLSASDVALLDAAAESAIATLTKYLDKNLYLLSTVVTLAPFLGLLGTVWGILITFSGMQTDMGAASNQVVLGGLSLALTTTVLGLVNAIPAVISYNYLKNSVHDFDSEMSRFANDVLSSIELHYRKVD